jgi:hypothetical protein
VRRFSAVLLSILLTAAVSPTVEFDVQIGPKTLIEPIQLCSTSGSTVAANTPSPPMFPLEFKKGDIPAGQYPQLQATDGTPWGATFINVRHWSDGSIKIAGVLPGPFPKAIPTDCVSANVLNGGSAPAVSGLTTTQLYNELIQLNANGFAGALGSGLSHTGNWSAKLANDANNVEVVNYGDGQGGRVYRILTHVQQGGTPHGQMEVYWYVQQLLNASGGTAGYRVLPRLTEPWYNHDTPVKDWRGLKDFNIQYGATPTTITPPFPYSDLTFVPGGWLGGNTFTLSATPTGYCDNVSTCQLAGYLTTTGTLPTGYTANTIYCGTYNPLANQVNFGACGNVFGSITGASSGGSGTHTFHPIPLLQHFGTLWGAQADGRYTYLQGSGTVAADAPILVKGNPVYDQATKLFPPYDMSLSPAPDPNNPNMAPFRSDPIRFDLAMTGVVGTALGATGERDDIGIRNAWCSRWFYNRSLVDDKYVRVNGLISGLFSNAVRDFTTRGPVHLGDPAHSYTGMPASSATTFGWSQFAAAPFTPPAHGGVALFFNINTTDHMPDLAGCAYLATGEPQYLDLQMEWANESIFSKAAANRNATVAGVDYYGTMTYQTSNLFREMAWGMRPIIDASAWWPDTDPAGTQIGAYLNDQRYASTHLPTVSIPLEGGWAAANCYWIPPGGGTRGTWNYGYMVNVLAQAANAAEDADALSLLDCSGNYFKHVVSSFGGYPLYSFFDMTNYDIGSHVGGGGTQPALAANFAWSAGTATITVTEAGWTNNLFTGMTVSVSAGLSGYNGTRTLTRTGPTTATFPLVANPGGSSSGTITFLSNVNDSDAQWSAIYSTSPPTSIIQLSWLAGSPGSFAVLYSDYTAYTGRVGGQSWNPTDEDKFIFPPVRGLTISPGTAPGGLEVHRPYYAVNTHKGAICGMSWSGGTETFTACSAHGIPAGAVVRMGITGNQGLSGTPFGFGQFLTCTRTTTTQFTCPLVSDPGNPTVKGEYNTAQLATSPGGAPLAITDTFVLELEFGAVPANAPPGYWVGFIDPGAYVPNVRGAISSMIASGITGLERVIADADARLDYIRSYWNIGSRGSYFRSNPKNAMQSSFGSVAP